MADSGDITQEGQQPSGAYVTYTRSIYLYNNLGIAVVRYRMRITGDTLLPDRTIDSYLTYRAERKYKAAGKRTNAELFAEGETKDDMEYFIRKLRAAENGYDSPVD